MRLCCAGLVPCCVDCEAVCSVLESASRPGGRLAGAHGPVARRISDSMAGMRRCLGCSIWVRRPSGSDVRMAFAWPCLSAVYRCCAALRCSGSRWRMPHFARLDRGGRRRGGRRTTMHVRSTNQTRVASLSRWETPPHEASTKRERLDSLIDTSMYISSSNRGAGVREKTLNRTVLGGASALPPLDLSMSCTSLIL